MSSRFNLNSILSKLFQPKYHLIIVGIFGTIVIGLTLTTIIFGALWNHSKSPSSNKIYSVAEGAIGFPIRLPNDGEYVQWTILQLNDVYEMLPLDHGQKGGLARVARIRQFLLEENPQTLTILSGDFLSPSALSQSIVNGTALNGKQMIAALNSLGLDFVTFGNHEFDLNQSELISRMNESTFQWISSNVFENASNNQPFSSSIPYKIISINEINILFIGLTIDSNQPYVQISNSSSLISFVQQFLHSLSNIKSDVTIALTHLSLDMDITLAENVPQIDLILGGHEHEDYYLLRGSKYIPITKADANALTVYIHRCAFHLNTRKLLVYPTITKITSQIEDEPQTAAVTNYWYNLGIKGFEGAGYQPNEIVSCLPSSVQLDGRAISVRNFPTLLTDDTCQSLLQSTSSNQTRIGIYNSGSIRIDDILQGKISQYDILRVFPFGDQLSSLSVPGSILANVLSRSVLMKGSGKYLIYCGIHTPDQGTTWLFNGTDISKTGLNYNIATITHMKKTRFNDPKVIVGKNFNLTQTQGFINYLKMKYPPC